MSFAGSNKATEAEAPYKIASSLAGSGTDADPWRVEGLDVTNRAAVVISDTLNDHIVLPKGRTHDRFCITIKVATNLTVPAIAGEFGCKIHVGPNDYFEGTLDGFEIIDDRAAVKLTYTWDNSAGQGTYYVI